MTPLLQWLYLYLSYLLGSIFIGYLTKDMIIGVGTDFWGNALFTHPQNLTMLEAEFIPHYIKLTPVILSNLGAISAFILYKDYSTELYNMKKTHLEEDYILSLIESGSLTKFITNLYHKKFYLLDTTQLIN